LILELIRQDCKVSAMWGTVNDEDEGEGIWLMGFIYTYKIE
jgi:hypothetical protein